MVDNVVFNFWNKKIVKVTEVHVLYIMLVCFVSSPVFAVQFCADFLEEGKKWLAINPFYLLNVPYFGFYNEQVYWTDENDDGCNS